MSTILNSQEITDKEFDVIREISGNHNPSQRLLAKRAGISLGLTNLIIERLVKKGYVKIIQMNQRKLRYALTPQGFAEKARKSYSFIKRTINSLSEIKEKTKKLIEQEYNNGIQKFLLIGKGELLDLTEIAIKELKYSGLNWRRKNEVASIEDDEVAIITDESLRKRHLKSKSNILFLPEKLI